MKSRDEGDEVGNGDESGGEGGCEGGNECCAEGCDTVEWLILSCLRGFPFRQTHKHGWF